jgi:hypothetical protein
LIGHDLSRKPVSAIQDHAQPGAPVRLDLM